MDKNLLAAMTMLAGAFVAFFFVFKALLTDGPSNVFDVEYLVSFALVIAAYGAVSFVLGRLGQIGSRSGVLLALPGTIIVAVYNDAPLSLRALLLFTIAVGTLLGLTAAWQRARPDGQAMS